VFRRTGLQGPSPPEPGPYKPNPDLSYPRALGSGFTRAWPGSRLGPKPWKARPKPWALSPARAWRTLEVGAHTFVFLLHSPCILYYIIYCIFSIINIYVNLMADDLNSESPRAISACICGGNLYMAISEFAHSKCHPSGVPSKSDSRSRTRNGGPGQVVGLERDQHRGIG
jgi:hypothetical protein